jgi:hypothetical protein
MTSRVMDPKRRLNDYSFTPQRRGLQQKESSP